jgi:tetratricopeptide (TPR) repeat protein
MKYYYYAYNDQQLGPFTVEELKAKRLKKSTLVWTEGMQDWASANDIEQLKDILISEPPPLPKNETASPSVETILITHKPSSVTSAKFTPNYDKETEATFIGVLLLVVPIIIKLSGILTFDTESYNQAKVFLSIGSFVIRIAVIFWVVNIASRKNRDSTAWGLFAFFLPSIALIVIGYLKRLKIELDGSLLANEQVSILLEKANQLFSVYRYSESIEILNKAIEIENDNFDCIKLRGLANYNIKNYQKAQSDFEILNKSRKFSSIANFYLGNLALIDRNRELAVSFWLMADEHKNKNAKKKLDHFHTFIGNYVLDRAQVMRKVNSNTTGGFIYFRDGKYQGGLAQIDQFEKLGSLKTKIFAYDLGLEIELSRTFKSFHIALSYYEIDNIVYKEAENMFELYLIDKKMLLFSYNQIKDYNEGLKKLCSRFKELTGKTPAAASSCQE